MKHIISCLAFFLVTSIVFAQQSQPIIFIMDASGSMWGQIGSSTKIETARAVLGQLIPDLPANQPLGLVAYGHRQKGDCADIEQLLPATNTDRTEFVSAVNALNPLGKTPLARSVTLVLDDLRQSGHPSTVILLTDGIETCEGDLCELVTAAKAEGIDFVLHIVGFDLGDEDRMPLQCAARAGDGLYLDAENGNQLASALASTTTLTVDQGEATLQVKVMKDGALQDASVYIYPAGATKELVGARTYAHASTNPAEFHLPAGTYEVEATLVGERGIDPIKRTNITITSDEITSETIDFTTGQLRVLIQENGALHDAKLDVLTEGNRRPVYSARTYTSERSNPNAVDLVPGTYRVVASSIKIKGAGASYTFPDVEVAPGSSINLSHNFSSGQLRVKVTKDGTLCDAIVALKDNSGAVDQNRTYTHEGSNPTTFLLSPGTYEVSIKGIKVAGDPQASFTVTVEAGKMVERAIEW